MANVDVKALCAYMLENVEKDPAETWLVLLRLANAGVTAFEISTHLNQEEMQRIVRSVRNFGSN